MNFRSSSHILDPSLLKDLHFTNIFSQSVACLFLFFFYKFIYLFIYLLCWVSVTAHRLSLVAARELLIAVASLVAEHGL